MALNDRLDQFDGEVAVRAADIPVQFNLRFLSISTSPPDFQRLCLQVRGTADGSTLCRRADTPETIERRRSLGDLRFESAEHELSQVPSQIRRSEDDVLGNGRCLQLHPSQHELALP